MRDDAAAEAAGNDGATRPAGRVDEDAPRAGAAAAGEEEGPEAGGVAAGLAAGSEADDEAGPDQTLAALEEESDDGFLLPLEIALAVVLAAALGAALWFRRRAAG